MRFLHWVQGFELARGSAGLRGGLESRLGRSAAATVATARHRTVQRLVAAVYRRDGSRVDHWRHWLGMLTMHRVWGLPVLAAVLWLGYRFVGVFGAGTLVGWMENIVFGRVINPAATAVLGLLPWHWLADFLVGFLRRDYGAAGLYALAQKGMIDGVQTVVALVVITLFVPCIANLLVIVKERGVRTAVAVVGFIIPFAFLVGGMLRWVLTWLGVTL